MIASVGPVLKVVVDGCLPVGEHSPVLADLALNGDWQRGEFGDDFCTGLPDLALVMFICDSIL